jgi:hypothetical protein
MKVEQYRDLASHLCSMARDLSQCRDDDEQEKRRWIVRAERLRLEAWAKQDTCPRATEADKAKMKRARAALDAAFDSVRHLVMAEMGE